VVAHRPPGGQEKHPIRRTSLRPRGEHQPSRRVWKSSGDTGTTERLRVTLRGSLGWKPGNVRAVVRRRGLAGCLVIDPSGRRLFPFRSGLFRSAANLLASQVRGQGGMFGERPARSIELPHDRGDLSRYLTGNKAKWPSPSRQPPASFRMHVYGPCGSKKRGRPPRNQAC
jgi:hypothetical protein